MYNLRLIVLVPTLKYLMQYIISIIIKSLSPLRETFKIIHLK